VESKTCQTLVDEVIKRDLCTLCGACVGLCPYFITHNGRVVDASEIAIGLGAPLLTNMVMAGAWIGSGLIPLEEEKFKGKLKMNFDKDRLSLNLKAFSLGVSAIRGVCENAQQNDAGGVDGMNPRR